LSVVREKDTVERDMRERREERGERREEEERGGGEEEERVERRRAWRCPGVPLEMV